MKTMKSFKFLTVALAALTMASCSKDDVANDLIQAGSEATLTINLLGEGGSTKAAGDAADAADEAINDFFVYVFRADGTLDAPIFKQTTTAATATIPATTAASEVYVVANTVGSAVNAALAAVKTKAELELVSTTLMNASNNVSNILATKVLMTGKSEAPIVFTEGNDKTATVAVTLSFPLAKISLIVKDQRTNKTGGAISIVDNNVVLLFAGKDITLYAADNATQANFYTGDATYAGATTTNVTVSTALATAAGTFAANDAAAVSHHFYTFANDGLVQPTILAIQSTKTTPAGAEKIYYPVIFNAEDAKQTIEAGKNYTVTLTLTGDVAGGEDGGTPDPEKPIISANVVVNITVTPWAVVPIDKEF